MTGESIIRQASLLIRHCWSNKFSPLWCVPSSQRGVGLAVFFRDRMCAHNYFHAVFFMYEVAEVGDVRTGRITYNHAGRKMNDLGTVHLHLFGSVLNIPARAAVTRGKTHKFDVNAFVDAECSLLVVQRTEAFASSACAIAITNDDSNFCFLTHDVLLGPSVSTQTPRKEDEQKLTSPLNLFRLFRLG